MSAKFIAQIEISKPCVSSASRPAEATRPRIVSSSGSPAATSEPNASTRIASVTGQEKSSDFIIALRFAVLKSLHIPEAPVSETVTPAAPAAFSFDFSVSAAATIAVGSPFAPAITIAVWPSAEIARAGLRRLRPRRRARSCASTCSTRATVCRKRGIGRRLRRASGRRPSAPSWRARRSSPGSAAAPAPTRSRSPASPRRRARSRPSARRRRARPRRPTQAIATART